MLDVAIIGGGTAGLSAALVLGRMRRTVLIVDSGQPRNAVSPAAHGFFSRDGIAPSELLQIGREQLAPYDTVELRNGSVVDVERNDDGFELTLSDGTKYHARKLMFATGVQDQLPQVDGLEVFWGTSVFHCPYCHGWEARDKPIAILADGDAAIHLATLLYSLSTDLVVCTNGASTLSEEQRALLQAFNIPVYEEMVTGVEGRDGIIEHIHFANGDVLERGIIFVRTELQQHSDLPQKLGCEINDYGFIQVDNTCQTTVPGVYAIGDMAGQLHQVIQAAANGAFAAARLNHLLATEQFRA